MAATMLGSLLVSLGLESGQFKSGLSDAEKELRRSTKRIEAIGKSMGDLGKRMSLAVTVPLVALGVTSVKAAMESREAIGQVNAALKSMGDGAGRTSKQLEGLASGLMRQSLYDDDEILRKVTANLLTFGNVAGKQFDRAQAAAVDLAARMGTDLQSATLMLGKALNSPAEGLAALRRVGIQFTEQQQEQIKAMTKAGDAAGAQTVMLKELERQFGGSAKAMRDADPMAAMKMSWAEFQETVGEKLLPLLPRIADALTKVLDAFGKLSPGMQTAVIAFAGLAAVFGPVLMGLGAIVTAMAPFLSVLGMAFSSGGVVLAAKAAIAGLSAVLGPFLIPIAAFAAAGYLIYQNWDKIEPVLTDLWQTIQTTIGPPLRELIAELSKAFSELWDGPLGPALKLAGKLMTELGSIGASVFGNMLVTSIKSAVMVIGAALQGLTLAIKVIAATFDGSLARDAVGAVRYLVEQVREWIVGKLGAIWDSVKAKIDQVKGWFFGLYDAVVGHSYIPDMVKEIGAEMAKLDTNLVKPAEEAAVRVAKTFKDMATETLGAFDRLASSIKSGGFLDILSSVIGFGLQLGSVGLFGKGIQANINASVPAYAGGTNFHPGGLAVVGERGPELVSMPRGSRVTPNGGMGGNVYHISGNLLTPEFWAMIQQGDRMAAVGGASLSQRQMARAGKWRL